MNEAIMNAYRQSLAELGVLEEGVQGAIKSINRKAFLGNTKLSIEEKEELEELGITLIAIRDSIGKLSHETLIQLDSSPQVADLVSRIEQLKTMVQNEAAKLGAIGELAELANKSTEALAQLAESAQELKDSFDKDTA